MDEDELRYCHHDDTDEYHDCLEYIDMECEECPYYYADLDEESDWYDDWWSNSKRKKNGRNLQKQHYSKRKLSQYAVDWQNNEASMRSAEEHDRDLTAKEQERFDKLEE